MKKIGVFAGTFDPIHNGHLAFAQAAIDQAGLDKVFFLVEPSPRRKQAVKAFEHRTRMVHLAIAHKPQFGEIILEQPKFTVHETLPILLKRFKGAELSMLLGDDVLSHLTHWPHVEHLVGAVHFVIGARLKTPEILNQHIELIQRTRGLTFQYVIIKTDSHYVSSRALRQKLRKGLHAPEIDKAVEHYIKQQQLYAAGDDSATSSV